jgi:hypothetical protein
MVTGAWRTRPGRAVVLPSPRRRVGDGEQDCWGGDGVQEPVPRPGAGIRAGSGAVTVAEPGTAPAVGGVARGTHRPHRRFPDSADRTHRPHHAPSAVDLHSTIIPARAAVYRGFPYAPGVMAPAGEAAPYGHGAGRDTASGEIMDTATAAALMARARPLDAPG